MEQLARHEKESKLHADNLAKKAAEDVVYRDRASERRAIHGLSDTSLVDTVVHRAESMNVLVVSAPISSMPVVTSAVPISQDNTGNTLLRKMGWEGDGLGKDGQGIATPVGLEVSKRDTTGLGAIQSQGIPSVSFKKGTDAYKKSVQESTRARFNQLP
jgi:hypothetical protein